MGRGVGLGGIVQCQQIVKYQIMKLYKKIVTISLWNTINFWKGKNRSPLNQILKCILFLPEMNMKNIGTKYVLYPVSLCVEMKGQFVIYTIRNYEYRNQVPNPEQRTYQSFTQGVYAIYDAPSTNYICVCVFFKILRLC